MQKAKVLILPLIIILTSLFLSAQEPTKKQRVLEVITTTETIKIDGILNEKTWEGKSYTGFTQSWPNEGQPATEKTQVWVAYDKKNVYIAARLLDSEPDKIISLLGRRDSFVDSDWFIVALDPYYDRRSGYEFAVNPAGSMVDWTIYNDQDRDATWNGVWEAKARIDEKGWTAEMKIPFSQLRYKIGKKRPWGIDFRRFIKRKNEEAGFVWIPQKGSGYVSHISKLTGIQRLKQDQFVEIRPYLAGKATVSPEVEGNPFEDGEKFSYNGGADFKIGLRSNLTLDLTINPDFGQVEVDPAVINLGANEVYFDEKREFFIEGANIFRFGLVGTTAEMNSRWGDSKFFYSRRIGRAPQGYSFSPGYVDSPDWTTILGAAKLSGKLGNGWNVGFLSAITQREYADIDNQGIRSSQEIEPSTYYGVLRVQKDINNGMQGIGIIGTAVLRNLRTPELKYLLAKNAFSTAMDAWTFLDKKKVWLLTGYFGGTFVKGSEDAIGILQQSYFHYYQRPDANYIEYDPTATSMNGWTGRIMLHKEKGNWMFNLSLAAASPGFNPNDMGFQWVGDRINAHIILGYRYYKPWFLFRRIIARTYIGRNYNFGGDLINNEFPILWVDAQFKNYWTLWWFTGYHSWTYDDNLTRGGPLAKRPAYYWNMYRLYSDFRKPLIWYLQFYSHYYDSPSSHYKFLLGVYWKSGKKFSLDIAPSYEYTHTDAQYITSIGDAHQTQTFGTRYIFGDIVQKTLDCTIRLNLFFTPRLSLQAYIQPFIAVGRYSKIKELARPKSYDFNTYEDVTLDNGIYVIDPDGPSGPSPGFAFSNPNFNYKSLRGTIVLRWEYHPGSTLHFVWTQNRSDFSNPGDLDFGRDIRNLLDAPGDNIFMLKLTHRFKL